MIASRSTTTEPPTYATLFHDASPLLRSACSAETSSSQTRLNGTSSFQPSCISWSYRSRGSVARIHTNADSSRKSLTMNQIRSEEHTSELQSQSNLVCRLLL